MKTIIHLGFSAAVAALLSAAPALAAGYVRNADVIALPLFVENQDGEMPGSPDDLLFDADRCDPDVPNPVLAPDGRHITWGEFSQVAGRASLRCGPQGTHVVIQLSGLIPKGVYTIWVVTFEEPGFTPDFEHWIGEGALGPPDGSRSAFTASASGQAAIAVHHPAGPLSVMGEVTACLLDEFEVHLVGAYHPDGQVHGPHPGPEDEPNPFCFFVEHFAFVFQQ